MRRAIELGLALLAGSALLPVLLLPRANAARLGRMYGLMAGAVLPEFRRVAMINVRRAFGTSVTHADARRAAWQVFAGMGESLAEGMAFTRTLRRAGASPILASCESDDPALTERILADGRPKIFLTGHLGSWELATIVAGVSHGRSGAFIARRVDNPFVEWLLRRIRFPGQFVAIEKRGAAREALKRLRGGESVAMLIDENAGERGVFVDFFGRPASTTRLPALLTLMTGAPIVLGAVVRASGTGGQYRFRLTVFEPESFADGDAAARIGAITQAFTARFEQWVRDDPWQWRWIHWRWKTRPEGDVETYTRRDVAACFRADVGSRGSSS